MLGRIRIKNFKCLRDIDVELAPFTVLIGPNDSGKSSFLYSLQLLGQLGVGDASRGDLARQNATILRDNCWRLDPSTPVSITVEATHPVTFQLSIDVTPEPAHPTQSLRIGHEIVPPLSMDPNPQGAQQFEFRGKRFQPQRSQPLLPQLIKAVAAKDLLSIQGMLRVSEPFRFSPPEMRKPAAASADPVLTSRGENLAAVINALLTGPDRDAVTMLESSLHAAIPTLRGLSTPVNGQNISERVIRFTLTGNEKPPLTIPASQVSDGAMFLTAFLTLIYSQPA